MSDANEFTDQDREALSEASKRVAELDAIRNQIINDIRNPLIVKARAAGVSLRQIAAWTGTMSYSNADRVWQNHLGKIESARILAERDAEPTPAG